MSSQDLSILLTLKHNTTMMKKLILIVAAVLMTSPALQAQSSAELAKQKREQVKINGKLSKLKPTKDIKKQAKELKKEGWLVPAGEQSIEQQLVVSQLYYGAELMTDENGTTTNRYIMQTAIQTAGSFNSGYSAARVAALTEMAGLLKTEIVSAFQQKLDNAQNSTISTTTVDKFNQHTKGIIDQSLTNYIPCVKIYRRLPSDNFEVQVRLAFDKKELAARLKRNMQRELEQEGDEELGGVVEEVLSNRF